MQSPVDSRATLTRFNLLPSLEAWRCPSTNGVWIDGEAYWKWLLKQPNFPDVGHSVPSEPVRVDDTDRVLISPRSGRIMSKFRVGLDLGFQIDFDRVSGGFWLDHNEYEALKAREMHDELHLICDSTYQQKLRELESAERRHDALRESLSPDGKSKVESLAEWANSHPDKEMIRAYFLELLEAQTH